jgi:hypothetical protein
VDVAELPYEDTPFKVLVQWDSGSRLAILEGHDDYRTVYDDDDGFNKEHKKKFCSLTTSPILRWHSS